MPVPATRSHDLVCFRQPHEYSHWTRNGIGGFTDIFPGIWIRLPLRCSLWIELPSLRRSRGWQTEIDHMRFQPWRLSLLLASLLILAACASETRRTTQVLYNRMSARLAPDIQ